jgi:threonylcarbamoyladenosine tRNA methylthiotransferase MtaB
MDFGHLLDVMQTFSIETLGCKVNQYESDQIAALLRSRGLSQVEAGGDVRVVNTCSVTVQAGSKSRQTIRRAGKVSLPVLAATGEKSPGRINGEKHRVIVTGCWATSDREEALNLPGVDAVLGHHDDVAADLNRLIDEWIQPASRDRFDPMTRASDESASPKPGTVTLPQLGQRQTGHQRAFLKIQDGCDAHCTYCIIPQLRPTLWSKPIDDAVTEAQKLVDSGHIEIVLTGIFMGAYGQPTALRRRQAHSTAKPLGQLIEALCSRVKGLARLRLSSLEPEDLSPELIAVLKSHEQVVPHFHLPLQSGSDALLRRMNRQYDSADFLRVVDQVKTAFDRPALTTDIIVGFPGETDGEFEKTRAIVDHVGFIHVHAFPYSPRPKTAAARWTNDFVRGPVVNQRIDLLRERAAAHNYSYRQQFVGQTVTLLVEKPSAEERDLAELSGFQHGRCERYFAVHFEADRSRIGELLEVRVDRVTAHRTVGSILA